ncbi:hypothetical protein PROFUN_11380 [Planoprotostelium fungivorum]|uniref:Saccharopine dehydrogenase NADP binding domain-containing protein n=1 Tax=Planoprotostelium fungivorum TaxID=1890364 RepID=A0A2P6N305_9EUKA|nr:hypothetical protein PROFUN_11380 [Planoprotostelium fungivorum]
MNVAHCIRGNATDKLFYNQQITCSITSHHPRWKQRVSCVARRLNPTEANRTQLCESALLRDLQIFESSVQKTKSTLEMLDRQEQEDQDHPIKIVDHRVPQANIGELRGVLAREEESVKHKEEYEQLCATIEKLPSRHREIQRMMQEGEMLEEKISLQKKQFHLCIRWIYSGPQTEDKQNCDSAGVSSLCIWKREAFGKDQSDSAENNHHRAGGRLNVFEETINGFVIILKGPVCVLAIQLKSNSYMRDINSNISSFAGRNRWTYCHPPHGDGESNYQGARSRFFTSVMIGSATIKWPNELNIESSTQGNAVSSVYIVPTSPEHYIECGISDGSQCLNFGLSTRTAPFRDIVQLHRSSTTFPQSPAGGGGGREITYIGTYHILGRVPGVESPGLHGGIFRFFVRTFITEKSIHEFFNAFFRAIDVSEPDAVDIKCLVELMNGGFDVNGVIMISLQNFARTLECFGPMNVKMIRRIRKVLQTSGEMDTKAAEKELGRIRTPGNYLVRFSSTPGCFAISVIGENPDCGAEECLETAIANRIQIPVVTTVGHMTKSVRDHTFRIIILQSSSPVVDIIRSIVCKIGLIVSCFFACIENVYTGRVSVCATVHLFTVSPLPASLLFCSVARGPRSQPAAFRRTFTTDSMQLFIATLLLFTTVTHAVIQTSPAVVFNLQTLVNTGTSRSLTVTNDGSSVNLNSATITGADQGLFSISPQTGAVSSSSPLVLTVNFQPTSLGPKVGNITLTFSDGETLHIILRGLPVAGVGGDKEPSLQYIIDSFALPYNVGDNDPTNALYNDDRNIWSQFPRGGEVVVQSFSVADPTKNITVAPIATFGPTDTNNSPTVFVGLCQTDSNTNCTELYSVGRAFNNSINPEYVGTSIIPPNAYSTFSFFSRWPAFSTRGDNGRVYQQDKYNTFPQALPHHVRVFPFVTPDNTTVPYTYLLTWEEYIDVVDFQDVIVILTNVLRPGEVYVAPTSSSSTSSSTSTTQSNTATTSSVTVTSSSSQAASTTSQTATGTSVVGTSGNNGGATGTTSGNTNNGGAQTTTSTSSNQPTNSGDAIQTAAWAEGQAKRINRTANFSSAAPSASPPHPIFTSIGNMSKRQEREYDIVIFGATSFAGALVTEYLLKNYKQSVVRWTIAGRSLSKLEELKKKVRQYSATADELQPIVADSGDKASLDAMAKRTRVVVSTVGPFAKYGSLLVQSCVDNKTDYIDITGEPNWVKKMIDQHHERAEKDGTILINMSGYDSIPSDLGTLMVVEHLHKRGAKTVEVKSYHLFSETKGGMSGGSLASGIEAAETGQSSTKLPSHHLCPDPKAAAAACPKNKDTLLPFYDEEGKTWTAPFIMSPVNRQVVRRSAVLLGEEKGYAKDFIFSEVLATPNALYAILVFLFMATFGILLNVKFTRELLKKYGPAAGTGPSRELIEKGSWGARLVGRGRLPDGSEIVVEGRARGHQDPGYGDTARILSEAAIHLVQNREKATRFGFVTPAVAYGTSLVDKLKAAGQDWYIQ